MKAYNKQSYIIELSQEEAQQLASITEFISRNDTKAILRDTVTDEEYDLCKLISDELLRLEGI